MVQIAIVVGLVAMSFPVAAAPAPAPAPAGVGAEPRTVTWYADNTRERARVQLACLDDPGRLARTPDCINSHQASVAVALRAARAGTGEMDPRKPAFWSDTPNTRRNKLIMCRKNSDLSNCAVARRSLEIEAQMVGR